MKNRPTSPFSIAITITAIIVTIGVFFRIAQASKTEQVKQALKETPTIQKGIGDGTSPNASAVHCGTPEPTVIQKQQMLKAAQRGRRRGGSGANLRGSGTVIIPVWFHVIRRNDGTGDVPNVALYAQLKVMNRAYSGRDQAATHLGQGPSAQTTADTPFRFTMAGITRTNNTAWYTAARVGAEQNAMKAALRVGGSGTLNVYLSESDGLLGYATFPTDYTSDPLDDGVVIFNESVPGGGFAPYDYGDTLVHEVGHWLGLFHTFSGGCAAEASTDQVADTPAEASRFFGLPASGSPRDTCTSLPGRDPVENYMDYTDDDGLFQFTIGQSDRMDSLHAEFRPSL
jgi:hypothetical protein